MTMTLREFITTLPALAAPKLSGHTYHCICPCHADTKPSFDIDERAGRILGVCRSCGAKLPEACAAWGVEMPGVAKLAHDRERETVHKYVDESGVLLYAKHRVGNGPGKKMWFDPSPKDRRVLYRMPQVKAAISSARDLWIVEGEKDADTMARHGLYATTWDGGAWEGGSPKWREELWPLLKGLRRLIVMLDNDNAGRVATQWICDEASRRMDYCHVYHVDLASRWPECPPKGDITDYVERGGNMALLPEWPVYWEPGAPPSAAATPSPAPPDPPLLHLPSGETTFPECARRAFTQMGEAGALYYHGGRAVEVVEENGFTLSIITPDMLRSRLDSHFQCVSAIKLSDGRVAYAPKRASREACATLLACAEVKACLPRIAGVTSCPILSADGRVLPRGYDPVSGWMISAGDVEEVALEEAGNALTDLLEGFDFLSPGDHARALASILTPCLRFAGAVRHVPMTLCEATESQSGKTYLATITAAVYNDTPAAISQRNGGVGSFDESIACRLAGGKPFILLDNLRGRLDSTMLESILTAGGPVDVRIPHHGVIQADPSHFLFYGTSNGVECTRDQANRMNVTRIRRRGEGFLFRRYGEGDLLDHIRARQGYYLGCVHAIVQEWMRQERPESVIPGNDAFAHWRRCVDWMVVHLCGAASVMEGEREARERLGNPALGFLRAVAAVIVREGKKEPMSASAIREIAEMAEIDIPGLRGGDSQRAAQQIGSIMARVFKKADVIDTEGVRVTRGKRMFYRAGESGPKECYTYAFEAINGLAPPPPQQHIDAKETCRVMDQEEGVGAVGAVDAKPLPEPFDPFVWPESEEAMPCM